MSRRIKFMPSTVVVLCIIFFGHLPKWRRLQGYLLYRAERDLRMRYSWKTTVVLGL